MTAKPDLLPLPELPDEVGGYHGDYWTKEQIEEYATAYARANLAELQREVEGLRAEVGRLQTKAAGAVDAARGYQRELAAEYARAERLEEALRPLAELDLLPDNLEKAPDWQTIYARNKSEIKVGDVRRARAALDQETTNG